jgi:hypothetical protein
MKNAIFLFLSFYLTITVQAQQILWQNTTNYLSYSSVIDTTENGGTVVGIATGSKNDHLFPNCVVNSSQSNRDIFVYKYDSNHNIIWRACLGSKDSDNTSAIKYLPDSSTIIAYTYFVDFYGYVPGLARISKNGTILWNRTFYSPLYPELFRQACINSIMYLSDKTLLISGYFTTRSEGNFGVLKLDLQGNTIWEKNGGGNYGLNKLIKTLDGGYMGIGVDYHSFFSAYPENHIPGFCDSPKGVSGNDVMLYKLDSQGNVQWKNCYGGSREDNGHDIIQLADSSYVFLAGTSSVDMDVAGNPEDSYYAYSIWLCHVNKNGSVIRSQCFGGSQTDIPARIFKKNNGNILVCGTTQSYDRDLAGKRTYNDYSSDLWIFEVNLAATSIIWQYVVRHDMSEGLSTTNFTGTGSSGAGDVVFNPKTNILNISSTNGSDISSGIINGWLLDIKIPDCIYQKNLTSAISSNTTINQTNYINTSSTINNSIMVEFTGSKAINLNQGFNTKNGVIFTAKITDDCGIK